MGAIVVLCWVCGGLTSIALAAPPSNDRIEKDVDDITGSQKYKWLRKQDTKQSYPDRTSNSNKSPNSNTGGAGTAEEMRPDDGCNFEPNFQDAKPALQEEPDSGCGNGEPPDCGCRPDIGSCQCEPGLSNCGNCIPAASTAAPVGYVLAAIALALIIFFIARAILQRSPAENIALEEDESFGDEDDEIRVSRIHRIDARSLQDKAMDAARNEDYKKAVGYLYLLAISILSKAGYVQLESSTTNWEIARQTQKNGGPYKAVTILIRHFEELFFGLRTPTVMHFEECRVVVERDFLTLQKEGGVEKA